MESYNSRRQWSDSYLPQLKALLGQALIEEATLEEDLRRATDLLIPSLRFAVRVRKSKWMERFGNEFTIRNSAAHGHETEYEKLTGFLSNRTPEYILYAFVNDDSQVIRAWLINIHQWNMSLARGDIKPSVFRNADGEEALSFPCLPSYSRRLI